MSEEWIATGFSAKQMVVAMLGLDPEILANLSFQAAPKSSFVPSGKSKSSGVPSKETCKPQEEKKAKSTPSGHTWTHDLSPGCVESITYSVYKFAQNVNGTPLWTKTVKLPPSGHVEFKLNEFNENGQQQFVPGKIYIMKTSAKNCPSCTTYSDFEYR